MRGNVWPVLAACTLLLLVLVTGINLGTTQAEVPGIERNITNDTAAQRSPAIWGDRIVWNERIQQSEGLFWEIMMYDLSTESTIRITDNASEKYNPEIYGDKIVWEDDRHGNFDIYMYDLSEDSDGDDIPNYLDDDDDDDGILDDDDADPDLAEKRITDNPACQEKPVIYGATIVWLDLRWGNKDIYLYDLNSGKEVLLAGQGETGDEKEMPLQDHPRIHGNTVVWEDERYSNGYWDVMMYNLSVDSDSDGVPNYLDEDRPDPDPAEERITEDINSDFKPSVYNDHIIYTRLDNVYVYDIQTKMEYKITNSTSGQKVELKMTNIHGTKIVFSYGSDSEYYVCLYDLSIDTDNDGVPNFRDLDRPSPDPALNNITKVPQTHAQPVIYTNRIVWQDDRNTSNPYYDIYLFTMTDNLPPEISYIEPDYIPQIEESHWHIFNITASDPDGGTLTYHWYVDGVRLPGETTDSFNYTTDYESAGLHEVRVMVSDGEYFVESLWYIHVAESGIPLLEITDYDPKMDTVLNETEEATFSISYNYLGSGEAIVYWEVQGADQEPMLKISGDGLFTVIEAPFDYNESDIVYGVNITTWITDGIYNVSHSWNLTVYYFNDVDGDGYSDKTEVNWSSDPLSNTSTPPDLDGDYIVDGEDDDIDGDGHLNKDDAYPLDPDRYKREDADNTLWILIIIIIIILFLVFLLAFSRIRKSQ